MKFKIFETFTIGILLVMASMATHAVVISYIQGFDEVTILFPHGEHLAETILMPICCAMGLIYFVIKCKQKPEVK